MFYWIALNFVQGIGSIKYRALVAHFHSPEDVFKASVAELCKVDGIGKKLAESIKTFNDFRSVDVELEKAKREGVTIVKFGDYPTVLKNINDAPPLLYVKGSFDGSDENAFGVVGARRASLENLTFAEEIGYKLAANGVTVVSGMAAGIDSAAHKGAVRSGGRTIAVLGCGVDIIYPSSNRELYEKIIESGAVISEFRLGTPPNKENFPRRNRIISGLSKGLLVVEANADSGSLITADCAIKQGRKLFAVPGGVKLNKAKGTNNLIKKGALLVDNAQDIFDSIEFDRKIFNDNGIRKQGEIESIKEDMSDDELKVFKVVESEAKHIDTIIKESLVSTSLVSGMLLSLELKGYVKQYPGKMFVKVD